MPHGVQGARGTLTGLEWSQFSVKKGQGTPSQNARGMRGLAGDSGRRAAFLWVINALSADGWEGVPCLGGVTGGGEEWHP